MSINSVSNSNNIRDIDIVSIRSRLRSSGNLFIIGLTGGIASGKTTVAEMLKNLGAAIIDFDILARKVVEPGTRGLADIVASFGSEILDSMGSLDRKALSRVIFRDANRRRELERLLHPAIFQAFCEEVKAISEDGKNPIIIAVIPLLIEMNLQQLFDKLIVVHLSSEIQLQRLMYRDHIDANQAYEMVRSQLPIEQKVAYADFLVDNSGDLKKTTQQVNELWKIINSLLRR